MMAIMFTKILVFRFKTKTRYCEKEKAVANNYAIPVSMSGFSQAHNHEHDANGNHEDHTEGTAHTVYHQLKSSWIPY
jgi:hypothetical protein